MNTPPEAEIFLVKTQDRLAGAESESANGRYNNCANRYYACFQAAIAALLRPGVHPPNPRAEWGHAFVQAQFAARLVDRRKEYPANLRDLLSRLLLRQTGDYRTEEVGKTQAERAARRARDFVLTIRAKAGRCRLRKGCPCTSFPCGRLSACLQRCENESGTQSYRPRCFLDRVLERIDR